MRTRPLGHRGNTEQPSSWFRWIAISLLKHNILSASDSVRYRYCPSFLRPPSKSPLRSPHGCQRLLHTILLRWPMAPHAGGSPCLQREMSPRCTATGVPVASGSKSLPAGTAGWEWFRFALFVGIIKTKSMRQWEAGGRAPIAEYYCVPGMLHSLFLRSSRFSALEAEAFWS